MVKLVKLKNSDTSFYVKLSMNFEFGIPSENWIEIQNKKIYHTEELIFIE